MHDGGRPRTRREVLRAGGATAGVGALGALAATPGGATPAETHTMLVQNAWLLDGVVTDDARISPVAKPALDERATAFGSRLAADDLDVVAFCEVFDGEQRDQIAAPLRRRHDAAIGPPAAPTGLPKSSGLYTLGFGDHRILATERMAFENDGNERRDADAYARKGVLFTRIAVGEGAIDLFTTHLLAGGGLPGYVSTSPAREPTSEAEYRRRQLAEFEAFVRDVKARHDPDGAVPIVCAGDFNIAPGDPASDALAAFREGLGLYDVWARHGDGHGGTNDDAITDGCTFDPERSPPSYCSGGAGGERIDYVFLEDDRPDVRVEDIRRRVFWRQLAPPDQFYADADEQVPNYLADHVGLELSVAMVPAATPPA